MKYHGHWYFLFIFNHWSNSRTCFLMKIGKKYPRGSFFSNLKKWRFKFGTLFNTLIRFKLSIFLYQLVQLMTYFIRISMRHSHLKVKNKISKHVSNFNIPFEGLVLKVPKSNLNECSSI